MYFVGHCYLTERSGVFDEDDSYGSGVPYLMLPDFGACHQWGYDHVWDERDRGLALVRAHIVADWYVHFGPDRRRGHRKQGWAYQRMRPAVTFYEEFFGRAEAEGLRAADQPRDSKRGFSHSMLEYAVDTHIARSGWVDDRWSAMQTAIRTIEDTHVGSAILDRYGAETEVADLPNEIWTYQDRVQQAREPEEVAFYCLARKFGLTVSPEAADFVRHFQDRLLTEMSADEMDDVCACVTAAIADPHASSWPLLKRQLAALDRLDAREGVMS